MKASLLFSVLVALLLGGCNGTISTIHKDHRAFIVTRDQAQRTVNEAITSTILPANVQMQPPGTLSCSGVVKNFPFSTTVNAVAIPVTGTGPNGKPVKGYGFAVVYWGSLPFPHTPVRTYRFIDAMASHRAGTFNVSPEEERKSRLDINYLRLLRP